MHALKAAVGWPMGLSMSCFKTFDIRPGAGAGAVSLVATREVTSMWNREHPDSEGVS